MAHRKTVALLAATQALLLTNGITLVTINGLLGLQLAPARWLATLPITTYVIGGMLATLPAAFFMKRYGRRSGFMLGGTLGMVGAAISALAVYLGSFWLLCFGTVFAGVYNAFGQQFRFAAADAAPPDWKSKAISLTLTGGIIGGVIGPEAAKHTRNLFEVAYLGSYLALIGFAALSVLIASRLRIPPLTAAEQAARGRPWLQIARQPVFIVAVMAAACGYGVMNLLMTATPLAMDICGLPFGDTAFILQWHVIGMFAPSFFTGGLIKRFGVLNILITGAALMFVCIAIALSGVTLMHFWWALVLLGIGWNFLFIGGTTLLTETYRAEEKAKVQGSNDFIVLGVQGLTSLSSGALITSEGWFRLNSLALPIVAMTALASALLWLHRRAARNLEKP
ncbi:MAG: MFS transporter [Rhodocyclales bacterium]|jgi:MFS family permease|nr:MFS transporter [Rhodocyclales bacterium]